MTRIRLVELWLEWAGFKPHSRVRVQVENGKLINTPARTAPATNPGSAERVALAEEDVFEYHVHNEPHDRGEQTPPDDFLCSRLRHGCY